MKAIKTKTEWVLLVYELSEMLKDVHEFTAVDVLLGEDGRSIEIYPASTTPGIAFYHTEEVVDFCRVKRLSNYASFAERNGKCVCYMRIF